MSTSTITIDSVRLNRLVRVMDYVELTKPRIGLLVLAAVGVSYSCARWGQPDPFILLHTLVGTFLIAASASALNQWLERRLDQRMPRTAGRPLPAGRLTAAEALAFAMLTIASGCVYLAVAVGVPTMLWGLLTWVTYVWLYTPLKTRTPLNTVIGAIAGALPVMIGWSAAQGGYSIRAAALFLIVFLWQFPHFMAIAWMYRDEYSWAGMRMWSVVDPSGRRTGVQAVCGALALLPISLIPGLSTPGVGGSVYLVTAFLLGLAQLVFAVRFYVTLSEHSARRLLQASLLYLPTLLILMLIVLWV